ncbi:hypothetical protein MJO29_007138 [Puccinia striiformis f. sp. tritici]|uniref:hypothetical protein n=1 Tax=Puccinia striiformis f. sp. tritici TaxID=168172 RepID=UPI0020089538|nr:hypothetical protein Pst134EA_013268 [Puccinia striiformis f. sp. tritici]KAH9465384.1 hypothetical protein Pst134EA_013268 [Puccinia striiformis f. sp. tritici]KAI7955739.1 hypothetical protein MJO29_007138 [Puccinia striiformis f. sp. tritici]
MNVTQPENVFVVQSIALHQLFQGAAKSHHPAFLPTILWVEAFLEPIAGALYVISAIPAIRKEGFWLFKRETNGMIRPNTHTLLPIFVLLYIICSLSSLICLLIDLDSTTILSARTVFLSLVSYPILLCIGWTKIWNVLRAIPLTKYGLATMRQTNGDSSLKFFRPRTINLLSACSYGLPLIFGSIPIGMIMYEVFKINQTITEYTHDYSSIISGQIDSESIANLNTVAVKQLLSILHSGDKVLFLSRVIGYGYFIIGLALLFIMWFGYYRILLAVGFQIDTFRKASEQAPNAFGIGEFKNSYKVESSPVSTRADSTSLCSVRVQTQQRHSLSRVTMHLSTWLPTLRPDPEFLEKSDSVPTTPHHDRTPDIQQWESLNQEMIHSQYKSLYRYKVNLIWQAFCNTLITLSFLGLNVMVFSNSLKVPLRHSLSDLIWFTITWASVSWVMTVGIPFGLVACIVSFSPPVVALRENEERVKEFDD